MAASSAASENLGSFNCNGNGLIIYVYPGCYFSQKVLLALHEKCLRYKPHVVNMFAGEHLQPWFLKLNPTGQLPVLQDGIKVIPSSDSIIEYLEDNFYNGNFPKLHPSKGTEGFQKVDSFVDLLNQVNVETLTFGSLYSPELAFHSTMSDCERKARLSFLEIEQIVVSIQKEFPENAEMLEQKMEEYHTSNLYYQDIEAIQKEINATALILDQIENELASHKEDKKHWWLCCDQFTMADVSLAVLLHRLDVTGLTFSLLDPIRCPHLERYKEKLKHRPAYKAYLLEVVQLEGHLKPPRLNRQLAAALGTVTLVGVVTALAVLYRRIRKV